MCIGNYIPQRKSCIQRNKKENVKEQADTVTSNSISLSNIFPPIRVSTHSGGA